MTKTTVHIERPFSESRFKLDAQAAAMILNEVEYRYHRATEAEKTARECDNPETRQAADLLSPFEPRKFALMHSAIANMVGFKLFRSPKREIDELALHFLREGFERGITKRKNTKLSTEQESLDAMKNLENALEELQVKLMEKQKRSPRVG